MLLDKIARCPAMWGWHYLRVFRGYTDRRTRSILKGFQINCALLATHSTFDEFTWTHKSTFETATDNYLEEMEAEYSFAGMEETEDSTEVVIESTTREELLQSLGVKEGGDPSFDS